MGDQQLCALCGASVDTRTCVVCGKTLPHRSRRHRKTCGDTCRWRLHWTRKKAGRGGLQLGNTPAAEAPCDGDDAPAPRAPEPPPKAPRAPRVRRPQGEQRKLHSRQAPSGYNDVGPHSAVEASPPKPPAVETLHTQARSPYPKLWPHQVAALETCWEAHRSPEGSRVLIQFPTGTGKTEIAARLAVEWVCGRPFGRALVTVPSTPVLLQFYRRLCQLTRLPVAIEKAHVYAPATARIIVASQQSIWGRLKPYARETLLIVDECHHSNLDAPRNLRVARSFHHVVGMSATPWSSGCERLFARSERVTLPLSEAQRLGLAAPLEILPWCPPRGPWALVFCTDNATCEARARALPGASWIGVDSGDVGPRIAAWRAGAVPVLFANRMLVEGFDEPRCASIWLAKQSDSPILYAQIAGRALRPQPGKVARIYCESPTTEAGLRTALARCG